MIPSNAKGFTLLELLLVVGIVGIILLLGIDHYRQAQRHADVVGVKTDVQVLKRALDNYFHQEGCGQDGYFSQMPSGSSVFVPDIVTDLGLTEADESHPPLVKAYHVEIIDTGDLSADEKPIYALRVSAHLAVPPRQYHWYQQQLDADQAGVNVGWIHWQSVPQNSYVQPNKNVWVMSGTQQAFRKYETETGAQAPQVSASYCAN